ncbi:MAG: phenylalanine--tRNA ligase subunit beta [Nanoarchaeota archaeon]
MPTITLNKTVFERLVGKKLPLNTLKDRISMLGTDLERIEGNTIEVEVFPNRPDMLCEQGFARAFSSFIGVKTGLRTYHVETSKHQLIVEKTLPKEWTHAYACIVRGLKFDDEKIREVIQIQEKLGVTMLRRRKKGGIGLYPLEKITFPIRFAGLDPDAIRFRPLEHDTTLTGRQILNKHPTGREYAHLVEGWKRFPVFIDANGVIMSMPPIINSHDVGKIDHTTTDVFLEITGNDPKILRTALAIIATALADMGGRIQSITCTQQDGTKESMPNLAPKKMRFDLTHCNRWLGLKLTQAEAKALLARMGHGHQDKHALVAAYRADIMHPVDLFEDIAIAYGYDQFKEEIPNISTIAKEHPLEVLGTRVATILSGLGLLELNTYTLTNTRIQRDNMRTDTDVVEVLNPVNVDYNAVKAWLVPTLLETLSKNKHNEYPQHIFDIGTVCKKGQSESGVVEETHIAAALCDATADYTKIRQVLDHLLRMLDIKYTIRATNHPSFIEGRAGAIIINGHEAGLIGETHPEVLSNFELTMPVAVLELTPSWLSSPIS